MALRIQALPTLSFLFVVKSGTEGEDFTPIVIPTRQILMLLNDIAAIVQGKRADHLHGQGTFFVDDIIAVIPNRYKTAGWYATGETPEGKKAVLLQRITLLKTHVQKHGTMIGFNENGRLAHHKVLGGPKGALGGDRAMYVKPALKR